MIRGGRRAVGSARGCYRQRRDCEERPARTKRYFCTPVSTDFEAYALVHVQYEGVCSWQPHEFELEDGRRFGETDRYPIRLLRTKWFSRTPHKLYPRFGDLCLKCMSDILLTRGHILGLMTFRGVFKAQSSSNPYGPHPHIQKRGYWLWGVWLYIKSFIIDRRRGVYIVRLPLAPADREA